MENSKATIRTSRWKAFLSKEGISWPTYALICLFGLGSWVAVNGLWVELPVLVKDAPEKWNLPSYLAVIFQLANIGPLTYALGNHFFPEKVREKCAIPFIVSIGAVSCALLGFYWDETSDIGGEKHSTVLFILSFFLAIVDCTSSVVFLTFMSIFPSFYMSALFVGETSSGLLPAFVALGQGINSGSGSCDSNSTNASANKHITKDDGLRFGPEGFFFFLFSIMVVCGLAFLALNYLPLAKRQHVSHSQRSKVGSVSENQPLFGEVFSGGGSPSSTPQDSYMVDIPNDDQLSRCQMNRSVVYLLCIQAWINCLSNGVLPSIQAYASAPYGDKTYHLVATLSSIASALTCFVALWIPCSSPRLVTILSSVYTILGSYVLVLASMSPTPPLHDSDFGSLIIILVSVTSGILISYTKLSISTMMRNHGYRALFWCGICIQIGSCVGAIIMFPLVNILKLFHQAQAKSC